jgi:hypothetical protein
VKNVEKKYERFGANLSNAQNGDFLADQTMYASLLSSNVRAHNAQIVLAIIDATLRRQILKGPD